MYNLEHEVEVSTQRAAKYEGYVDEEYYCPAGYLTIGHGRNIEVYPLAPSELPYTEEKSLAWTKGHIKEVRKSLMIFMPWLVEVPVEVRLVFTDMAFNMGLKKFKGFKKMIKAARDGDYRQAAEELKDSNYFEQTGNRAKENYQRLKELGE